ncbi:MAG: hypothetical protein ACP5NO_02080 [Thermoplasmata archaeon]
MRSNLPQYFLESVNKKNRLEAGETGLWQRIGFILRNKSPSSDRKTISYNSLYSPNKSDLHNFQNIKGTVRESGFSFLSLADNLILKSKPIFMMLYSALSVVNSISMNDINYNRFFELPAIKCEGGDD